MPVEVKLPQLGESTYEGTIGKWLKQPGQPVERFEPLVEIITDKVNVEMPAPYGGTLAKILVPEGETVAVGTPIALMETAAAEATAAQPVPPVTAGVSVRSAGKTVEERPRLSPVVRKLAEEHALPMDEVARIAGTGAGGRITKEDVLAYVAQRRGAAPAVTVAQAAAPLPASAPGLHSGDRLVKLTPLRRSIAQRMAQSKREIPHAYGVVEADVTALVRWRETHKAAWQAREGVNVTYTAFFVRAAVEALRAYPSVNAAWSDDGIVLRGAINVGIGIALDEGLIVAVIHQADRQSLVATARALDALGARARDGKLTLDDVQGGTFTLTNPGVFGSIWSMPIILPGQAAILATDAIVKRPVVRDDAIAIRDIMHLGLSFDHRVFDGAVADQFLNHIKQKLETVPADDAGLNNF